MEVLLATLTLLFTMVACRPTSSPQQTSSQARLATHHRQRQHYQSLREAVHATADLLFHSKHAFHLLCREKSHILPTFDDELSTCQGFAGFIGTFHRERLNLPQIDDIKLPTTRSFTTQLKHVLTQSVHIMTSYQYVITNVTTLENRRLCQHSHGLDDCEISCRTDDNDEEAIDERFKFWCRCDKVAKRVKAAQQTYIHALRSLRMPVPEPQNAPDVSIQPPSRDSHVVSYHFAALHSLSGQTEHIENALSFVSNLARHEVL